MVSTLVDLWKFLMSTGGYIAWTSSAKAGAIAGYGYYNFMLQKPKASLIDLYIKWATGFGWWEVCVYAH